ncbi:hypothetical protein Cni_G12433 [Canna indica]|uniref:Nucleolus and neural progenitor protein-like N-terminal domain-containing protein n=1 Tax=Canna indica TaxID=4628 RepID=A0AAQ3KAN0_9LILI|nr:hypothetical protein Cni_G12433 [Canna indica]
METMTERNPTSNSGSGSGVVDGDPSSKINERLHHLLVQFEIEAGILDRIVYKNKNQHRRGSYFQFLLKVRRDVRLLQSTGLGEILKIFFSIIDGKKTAQKVFYPTRSKSISSGANHNVQDRLLGVARLLSQMAEPILKAATEISLLLAKSFFTGFCITVLALLARLRVLVQQILQDVVLIFNKVSSLTLEKQSVKLSQDGIEAFREYYPSTKKILSLDCVWREDKFLLLERTENKDNENKDEDIKVVPSTKSIQYDTFELFNEVSVIHDESMRSSSIEANTCSSRDQADEVACSIKRDPEGAANTGQNRFPTDTSEETITANGDAVPRSSVVKPQSESKRKVAFVPVKRSNPSDSNTSRSIKKIKLDSVSSSSAETEDPFLNLLISGTSKNSA